MTTESTLLMRTLSMTKLGRKSRFTGVAYGVAMTCESRDEN
jgi:hypothetical protein